MQGFELSSAHPAPCASIGHTLDGASGATARYRRQLGGRARDPALDIALAKGCADVQFSVDQALSCASFDIDEISSCLAGPGSALSSLEESCGPGSAELTIASARFRPRRGNAATMRAP